MFRHCPLFFILVSLAIPAAAGAQTNSGVRAMTDSAIRNHRMGALTVMTAPGAKVTVRQLRHEFRFGTAVSSGMFRPGSPGRDDASASNAARYRSVLAGNFNAAVHENALKWYATEREREGDPDYSVADSILSFCEANGIAMRGHCIFWGIEKYVQPWVKAKDDPALRRSLARRAMEVTARYRGRIPEYDLNNEMVHGDYYRDRLGDRITRDMFNWAKAGDPDAILYVNDYSILSGRDLGRYLAQIRDFRRRGIPVGGIGVQGHFGESVDIEAVRAALDSLARFGLPVTITEYDLNNDDERVKAETLDAFYRTCFAHPAVNGILMWGFWEGAHWRPRAALWKKDWTPTMAAEAYRNLVFNEWWTTFEGTADGNGVCRVPAFFGTHLVTAGDAELTVNFSKTEGAKTVYLGIE